MQLSSQQFINSFVRLTLKEATSQGWEHGHVSLLACIKAGTSFRPTQQGQLIYLNILGL